MKKKVLIISLIFLGVFSLIFFSNIKDFVEPDKTITIGYKENENTIRYGEVIRDEEKVRWFEKWFEEIIFDTGEWREEYPDITLRINNNTKGYTSHTLEVWSKFETAVATIEEDGKTKKGKVHKSHLEEILEEIKALIEWAFKLELNRFKDTVFTEMDRADVIDFIKKGNFMIDCLTQLSIRLGFIKLQEHEKSLGIVS